MPHPAGRVDVVIGDRHGVACADEIVSTLEELMRGQGLRTLRNKPYSGGFITQNYGSPAHQRHALQIEINRAVYLDERTLERGRGYPAIKATLHRVFAGLLAALPDIMQPRRQAAE
jgi:N-formylglutamate amidohydrolase